MQKGLLATGFAAGLLIALMDSAPRWDDSGLTAGALALSGGLLTLLGYRRPWLMALVIGIWIPLRSAYLFHDFRTLLVLVFPLLGAYAGWLIGLQLRKVSQEA